MHDVTAKFLLEHPELVAPVAPWCSWLNNLELGLLLLAQPWLAGGGGLQRADMERQLSRLGTDMPIGPVYFQRVNRSVASLQQRGQLAAEGSGRSRRFVLTPEGFAALILNLQVLRADPTLDGSEFEFKRALVAMGNVALERVLELPAEVGAGPELTRWFDAVDRLEIWGHRIVSEPVLSDAFSILRLIELERERVERLRAAAERRLEQTRMQAALVKRADLSQLGLEALGGGALLEGELAEIRQLARELAAGDMPRLSAEAQTVRYAAYLSYLDDLVTLYSGELKVIDIAVFRRVITGRTV